MTLKDFEEKYLSLHCATKKHVFVNGKVQVIANLTQILNVRIDKFHYD